MPSLLRPRCDTPPPQASRDAGSEGTRSSCCSLQRVWFRSGVGSSTPSRVAPPPGRTNLGEAHEVVDVVRVGGAAVGVGGRGLPRRNLGVLARVAELGREREPRAAAERREHELDARVRRRRLAAA